MALASRTGLSPLPTCRRGKVVAKMAMRPWRATKPKRAGPPWGLSCLRVQECYLHLRCRPGDLALVIRDTLRCDSNLGRIVVVRGPLEVNRRWRLPCWLIRPVTSAPYAVEKGRRVSNFRVYWKSRVEHPDAWLLPLRGLAWADCDCGVTGRISPVDWDATLSCLLHNCHVRACCLRPALSIDVQAICSDIESGLASNINTLGNFSALDML